MLPAPVWRAGLEYIRKRRRGWIRVGGVCVTKDEKMWNETKEKREGQRARMRETAERETSQCLDINT